MTIEISHIDWEIEKLIQTRLFPDEQAVLRSALRALFQTQPHLKSQMISRTYAAGEISLGKAATLLGVSHEEMKDILKEQGILIPLGPDTIDELMDDAAHA